MTNDLDLDALRAELDCFAREQKDGDLSPQQERLIADFEEIRDFVDEHGHPPAGIPDADIFERIYFMRLKRMAQMPEAIELLKPLDTQGLLETVSSSGSEEPELNVDALISELTEFRSDDLQTLAHVRPHHERQPAEDVAERHKCPDFEKFEPLFEQVRKELKTGLRETRRFGRDAAIRKGDFFILHGQIIYVAEEGEEELRTKTKRPDRRLRVIYDNGMESDILMRSLQRALYKDRTGRRIIAADAGPLFGAAQEDGDTETGTIYVVRSKSDHPLVKEYGDLLHKIGVTTGDVRQRLAGAKDDPTFLLADVELVESWKLANINPRRLEEIIHRVFAPARVDIELRDRFGKAVHPREWFLVPLFVIEEAVEHIRDGSITDYIYDPGKACLQKRQTS